MERKMVPGQVVRGVAFSGLALLASACSVYPQPIYASASIAVPVVTVPEPPPAPMTVVVVQTSAPGPDYLWLSGYWNWSGHQYVWIDAHWEPPHYGYYWMAPTHVTVAGSVKYTPGHWKQSPGGKYKSSGSAKAYQEGTPKGNGGTKAYQQGNPKGNGGAKAYQEGKPVQNAQPFDPGPSISAKPGTTGGVSGGPKQGPGPAAPPQGNGATNPPKKIKKYQKPNKKSPGKAK